MHKSSVIFLYFSRPFKQKKKIKELRLKMTKIASEGGPGTAFKVARNEVKNASFAQRFAHRNSRIWRLAIDSAALRKRRTQPFTSTQIGLSRPIVFARVLYFIKIPAIMFGFSESADMCLSFYKKRKKHFRQILRNSRKCVKIWTFKNFNWLQKRLGFPPKSLWKVLLKFSYRWAQYR